MQKLLNWYHNIWWSGSTWAKEETIRCWWSHCVRVTGIIRWEL